MRRLGRHNVPIAVTPFPSGWGYNDQPWCGRPPAELVADGTILGYDGPDDTNWKTYFPKGMSLGQMMFLYWRMRDFKITVPGASMASHETGESECPNDPGPGTHTESWDLHKDAALDGFVLNSTDDPDGRNAFYPNINVLDRSEFPAHPAPEHLSDLVCFQNRVLFKDSLSSLTGTYDNFYCGEGTTTEGFSGTAGLNFHLFDPYDRPPYLYSPETQLFYPAIRLQIHTNEIDFIVGNPSLYAPGESGPGAKAVEGTLTLKARTGSPDFAEDIVIPGVVIGNGYADVTSVSTMDVTLEITAEWPD